MTEADVTVLRGMLTDQLWEGGKFRRREVAEAFREVPRHVFVPAADPVKAYADEAIPVKWAADGRPLSSSSQPAMMALMLEQLRAGPGQRVLEIGTGTGYNAALLAHIVGGTGAVVTVEIDDELARLARERLTAAGYPAVEVISGDGALGWSGGAPYDRIIVTAGAQDLAPAWTGQLGDGGLLLVPLSLRGVQQCVLFEQAGDHLASVSVLSCGFMPLRGKLSGHDPVRSLGETPGVFLRLECDRDVDLAALHAALSQPPRTLRPGTTITGPDLFGGLGMWLALHDPDVGELAAVGPAADRGLIPAVTHLTGIVATKVLVGQASLAAVTRPPGMDQATAFECYVCGYGPDGEALADRLAAGIRAWNQAGRPASQGLRIRAYPASEGNTQRTSFTITMQHTRFLLNW